MIHHSKDENHPPALAVGVAEAARLLGVSERHVRSLAASGVVHVVKLGGRTLYPVDALKALLAKRDETAEG